MQIQETIYNDAASSPIVYPSMTNVYREDKLKGVVPQVGEKLAAYGQTLQRQQVQAMAIFGRVKHPS